MTTRISVVHRILLQNSHISSSIPIRLLYFHSWSPIFPIYFWAKNGWDVCNYISIILKTRLDVSTAACHPKSLQTTHATLLESQLDAGCNIVASKTMLDEMFIRPKKNFGGHSSHKNVGDTSNIVCQECWNVWPGYYSTFSSLVLQFI